MNEAIVITGGYHTAKALAQAQFLAMIYDEDRSAIGNYLHVQDLTEPHGKEVLSEESNDRSCSRILQYVLDSSTQNEPSMIIANQARGNNFGMGHRFMSDVPTLIETPWKWHLLLSQNSH